MSKPITLANKKPVKKFIKTHPHHSLLFGVGAGMLGMIVVMGALIWTSSSHLYAEQQSTQSSAYIAAVSKALAGTSSASAAAQSQSSRQTTQAAQATASTATTTAAATTVVPKAVATTSSASSNLKGLNLYVDPARASLPAPLGASPVAVWFGNWNSDIQAATNGVVSAASAKGSIATLVAYDIPGRDCGSYSAGGANGSDAYKSWIRSFAAGIGQRQAIVILEPDALADINCLDTASQNARYTLLEDAVTVLTTQTKAFVYLDAGHSNWIDTSDMATRLQRAGIAQATGFSLNVSNFETTSANTAYGNIISSKVGGKHFVIDTSRNGNGAGTTWCNPSGRALGALPTVNTSGNVDAYLWVKVPGESDGTCNGGPSAGTYWSSYAQSLIANSGY